jgi:pimeloyl-ACP methyl ester carboxylesterase
MINCMEFNLSGSMSLTAFRTGNIRLGTSDCLQKWIHGSVAYYKSQPDGTETFESAQSTVIPCLIRCEHHPTSSMAKPQIVLVPGAAHTPECMVPLMDKLRALGYTTHCRQMASVDNPNPPADLSEDIAVVRSVVEEAIGQGNDVIIVPHSWGGVVTGTALQGVSKQEREAEGLKGGVTRIAYMASFMLPEGMSLMARMQGTSAPRIFAPTGTGPNLVCVNPEFLYNDLPEHEQKHWATTLKSHGIPASTTPTTDAAWRRIPTSYLVCEDDLALPLAMQELMIQEAKEAGVEVDVTRIKSGHSPFLSRVDETAEWIRRAAGETAV